MVYHICSYRCQNGICAKYMQHMQHLLGRYFLCLVWDMCQIFSIWHISHIYCGCSNASANQLQFKKYMSVCMTSTWYYKNKKQMEIMKSSNWLLHKKAFTSSNIQYFLCPFGWSGK